MARLTKVVSLRLPESLISKIETRASELGVSTGDLIKSWVLSQVENKTTQENRALTAITIAALSETIDLETAKEIISSYLEPKEQKETPND